MFDTPVINVAIGLVFAFAAVSLAASTVAEAFASLVKLRANTLLTGIQAMLNDPTFSGLAQRVYQHGLVHPRGDGQMASRSRWWTYSGPSYIRPENFATALTDVLTTASGRFEDLKASIEALPDAQVRDLLLGMHQRADGQVKAFETQLSGWFDTTMDRVSGAYKRQAQLICFLAGLGIAASINVDATHIVSTLWANPERARAVALRVEATATIDADLNRRLDELQALPVGPEQLADCPRTSSALLDLSGWPMCASAKAVSGYNLLGWLITAVASVFGAPFWFDLLGKLVQLRGAGPRPGPAKPR